MGALIDFIAPAGGLFFCLMLLGMIFLSAAWYIHNMAPVIVAQFTSRDANVPIYWADNTVTVGARDGADAVFPLEAGPKSDDRPDDRPGSRPGNRPIQGRLIFSRARLMADDPDNPPWLFESASGGAKPLRSGDEVDLFDSGRTYRFESFISRENMKQKRFPPRFSWILALCAMAFLVELAMSFHAGARASALMTADPAGLQRQIIRIAETLASNPDSAQTLFGWAVCLSGLFLTLIHFGMFWFTALKQPR
ncbi:MAG: hypothetical protein LBT44_09595, partial [Clostridiales bacterium]|nr:hypothetical protein [Clostridiales bacterium]